MTLKAVIFDMDGTLADSERDGHRVAFNAAFRDFGLDWQWGPELYGELLAVAGGRERIRAFVERAHPEMAHRPDLEAWVGELHRVKGLHFADLLRSGRVPLRPGARRLLVELHKAGMRLALATTASAASVRAVLDPLLGGTGVGWFEVLGSGDVVRAKKPAPDLYQWVLERLQLAPRDCIAIEDSEAGLRAALAAGVPTVVAVSDYTRHGDFGGALAVLSDLGEPGRPFRLLAGAAHGRRWVDLEALQAWHHEAVSGKR